MAWNSKFYRKRVNKIRFTGMIKRSWLAVLVIVTIAGQAFGQNERQVADRIAAIVGDEIVLQSEVMKSLAQTPGADTLSTSVKRCKTLAKTIEKKLLLTKAKTDSINVKDSRVEAELNRRIQYFVRQIGSRDKLEDYYEKSIPEIREQFRDPVRELLRSQRMKRQLLADVSLSPQEVKSYFQGLPQDSIPYFNTQVKLAQIVKEPKPTQRQRKKAKSRLRELRKRIVDENESFDNLAILYSDDESSATDGGDLGMQKQTNLNNKLASVAIQLTKGEVSNVIETKQGFHLVKLLERKGNKVHIKHILKEPSITSTAKRQTRNFLDSLRQMVLRDSLSFERAAIQYSDDEQTRNNGGLITNQQTGATKIPVKQLNSEMFFNADTMAEGSISEPLPMSDGRKTRAYRIIQVKEKSPPHRANLQQDYPRLKRMAVEAAKQDKLKSWYRDYAKQTYLKIQTDATSCQAMQPYLMRQ